MLIRDLNICSIELKSIEKARLLNVRIFLRWKRDAKKQKMSFQNCTFLLLLLHQARTCNTHCLLTLTLDFASLLNVHFLTVFTIFFATSRFSNLFSNQWMQIAVRFTNIAHTFNRINAHRQVALVHSHPLKHSHFCISPSPHLALFAANACTKSFFLSFVWHLVHSVTVWLGCQT